MFNFKYKSFYLYRIMFFNIITHCAVEETIYRNQFYLIKTKLSLITVHPFIIHYTFSSALLQQTIKHIYL